MSVPLAVSEITVADGRKAAGLKQIAFPRFAFKKRGDTAAPPLTMRQEQIVREEALRYVSGAGRRVRITATLKDGVKQWEQGFLHSREFARTTVALELYDGTDTPCFFSTTGESNYEVKAVFADTAFLEALYQKALKTSVNKAFESIRDFLAKEQADTAIAN